VCVVVSIFVLAYRSKNIISHAVLKLGRSSLILNFFARP